MDIREIEEKIWFQGRATQETRLDLQFVGQGTDQEGPGFYFSDHLEDASKYAAPNGVVLSGRVHLRKLASSTKKANPKTIQKLIEQAPDLEMKLTDWDENPEKALLDAITSTIKYNHTEKDAFQQVWIDFYKTEPVEYLQNLVALGYDGHVPSGSWGQQHHLVLYNPRAFTLDDHYPYAEGSTTADAIQTPIGTRHDDGPSWNGTAQGARHPSNPAGWIGPDGKWHNTGESHFQNITRMLYQEEYDADMEEYEDYEPDYEGFANRAYNEGWVSVGHAGGANCAGLGRILKDPRSPQVQALIKLFKDVASETIYVEGIGGADSPKGEYDLSRFLKTGRWVKHNKLAGATEETVFFPAESLEIDLNMKPHSISKQWIVPGGETKLQLELTELLRMSRRNLPEDRQKFSSDVNALFEKIKQQNPELSDAKTDNDRFNILMGVASRFLPQDIEFYMRGDQGANWRAEYQRISKLAQPEKPGLQWKPCPETLKKIEQHLSKTKSAYDRTVKTPGGKPVEVFKNPSRKELKDLAEHDEVRAFLVGNDLYCWGTYGAIHHQMSEQMPIPDDSVALNMNVHQDGKCYWVNVSDWTRRSSWFHNPDIKEYILNHPMLRLVRDRGPEFEIGYFDEAIGGPWDEMGAEQDTAGIEDTDFPLYHVSDHPERPTIRTAPATGLMKRAEIDPLGIYLFPKKEEVNWEGWDNKAFRWDAKLKNGARELDLNDSRQMDEVLHRAKVTPHSVIRQIGDWGALSFYKDRMVNLINNIERHLKAEGRGLGLPNIKSALRMYYESSKKNKDLYAEAALPILKAWQEWIEPCEHKWGALVTLFQNGPALTDFLKKHYDVLDDRNGQTVLYGEPQYIVLNPSVIEWGKREKNERDDKVYKLRKMGASVKASGFYAWDDQDNPLYPTPPNENKGSDQRTMPRQSMDWPSLKLEAKAGEDDKLFNQWYKAFGDDQGLRIALNRDPYDDEDPIDPDEARGWFDKRLRVVRQEVKESKRGQNFAIYRCLQVPSDWLEKLKAGEIKKLGHHWTISRDIAPYLCGGHGGKSREGQVVLEALCPASKLDIMDALNPGWADEWEEFEVGVGQINLVCVWDHEMKNILWEPAKPQRMVAAEDSGIPVRTFVNLVTKYADSLGFADPEVAYWQCTDFSYAVWEAARLLDLDAELWSAEVEFQHDIKEIRQGEKVGHIFLKIDGKYYDFTSRQADARAAFPIISDKPPYVGAKRTTKLEKFYEGDPAGPKHYLDGLWKRVNKWFDRVEPLDKKTETVKAELEFLSAPAVWNGRSEIISGVRVGPKTYLAKKDLKTFIDTYIQIADTDLKALIDAAKTDDDIPEDFFRQNMDLIYFNDLTFRTYRPNDMLFETIMMALLARRPLPQKITVIMYQPPRNKSYLVKDILQKGEHLLQSSALEIQAHRQGDTIWIDEFVVPAEQRGQGIGTKYYKEWEAQLPKDIHYLKLMAADTGAGPSQGFWGKMGFEFVYDTDNPQTLPYEQRQEMVKGINGTPTPTPIQASEDEEDEDLDWSHLKSIKDIEPIRADLARAAQKPYDEWTQDSEGIDEMLGAGGICHLIVDELLSVLDRHGFACTSMSLDSEVHVVTVLQVEEGIYILDIPYGIYERGGGYNWKKIPDVQFEPGDLTLRRVSADPADFNQYQEG